MRHHPRSLASASLPFQLLALSGCLILSGCLAFSGGSGSEAGGWEAGPVEGELSVTPGALSGQMGGVPEFSGRAECSYAATYDDFTSIELRTEGADWGVMGILSIEASLDDPRLAPGALISRRLGDAADPEALIVDLLGCSGPSLENYTYDQMARDVQIRVSEGSRPGSRRYEIRALFEHEGEPQQVYAELEVEL